MEYYKNQYGCNDIKVVTSNVIFYNSYRSDSISFHFLWKYYGHNLFRGLIPEYVLGYYVSNTKSQSEL